MAEKRKRETNFSQNEKQLLISIISKYSTTIEDKKTDRTSMEAKTRAWKDIEREFNASSSDGVFRNGDRLKKCYTNKKHDIRIMEAEKSKIRYMQNSHHHHLKLPESTNLLKKFYEEEKKMVKKDVAEENKYITQTGMGRVPTKKKDGTEELMLSIMNKKSVYGLDMHPFDSDNHENNIMIDKDNETVEYIYQRSEIDDEEVYEIEQETISESKETCQSANETTTPNVEEIVVIQTEGTQEEMTHTPKSNETKWNVRGFAAKQLAMPITTELKTDRSKVQSPSGSRIKSSRRRPTTTVKALTSSIFAEKYEGLLEKRLILTNKQIEDFEEEQVFRKKKRNLELELLTLQIEALKGERKLQN